MKVLIALPLLALAACSDGSADVAAVRPEIEGLIKGYHEAYDLGDAGAVIGMLDPDVAISRPSEGRFLNGREACAEQLKKDIDKLKAEGRVGKRKTIFEAIRIDVNGPIAVATYATLVKEEPKTYTILFTRAFRYDRNLKRWLIYREHY